MLTKFRLLPTLKSKTKVVSLGFGGGLKTTTDESVLPQTVATECFNCDGIGGALVHRYGVSRLKADGEDFAFPFEVKKIWVFCPTDSAPRLMAFCADGNVYSKDLTTQTAPVCVSTTPFTSTPDAVQYKMESRDSMLFCSATDSLCVFDSDGFSVVADSPTVSSMCVHYERLFGCRDNTLWFSDDLNPTNWNVSATEAGYIEMADDRGKLQKVVSFSDYLYVFREYGIARVAAFSSQAEFTSTQLFVCGSKIYPDTVAVCGDKIVFLSEDGLYAFDGADTAKLASDLDGLFVCRDNSSAQADYFNGRYVLSCNLQFKTQKSNESGANNALLVVDFNRGLTLVRGVDVRCVRRVAFGGANKLLLCVGGQNIVGELDLSGQLFGKNSEKRWQGAKTDLGQANARKQLLYLSVTADFDCNFTVDCDGESSSYFIGGQDGGQKIKLDDAGFAFVFGFETDTQKMRVADAKLVFKTYSEEL